MKNISVSLATAVDVQQLVANSVCLPFGGRQAPCCGPPAAAGNKVDESAVMKPVNVL